MRYPDKPRLGDRIAVLSPGVALPEIFPPPFELGLQRLQETYGVRLSSTPRRARSRRQPARPCRRRQRRVRRPRDHGGPDQHRRRRPDQDPQAPRRRPDRANPKPFFGLSDNTNLHNFLWNLGIVSYYGGVVMTDLGRRGIQPAQPGGVPGRPLRRRLVRPAARGVVHRRPPRLGRPREPRAGARDAPRHRLGVARRRPGRSRDGCGAAAWRSSTSTCAPRATSRPTTRRTTGACCTSRPPRRCPPRQYVGEVLMCMGERGLLRRFGALLMGRPEGLVVRAPERPAGQAGVRRRPARGRARRDGGVLPRRARGARRRLRAHRPAAGDAERRRGPDRPCRAHHRRPLLIRHPPAQEQADQDRHPRGRVERRWRARRSDGARPGRAGPAPRPLAAGGAARARTAHAARAPRAGPRSRRRRRCGRNVAGRVAVVGHQPRIEDAHRRTVPCDRRRRAQ